MQIQMASGSLISCNDLSKAMGVVALSLLRTRAAKLDQASSGYGCSMGGSPNCEPTFWGPNAAECNGDLVLLRN